MANELKFRLAVEGGAQVEGALSGIVGKLDQAAEAATGFGAAAGLIRTAFEALGVGLSIKWATDLVKGSIDAAAALAVLSIKTGATVESLSSFEQVGKLSGTSIDSVGAAMNRLAKNMAVSNEESKGTAQALKALGINFADFAALTPDQKMYQLAVALNRFEDGSAKSAVAMTLMGKSGAEMLPFFRELAERGMVAATTMTAQALAAKAFNDALDESRLKLEQHERQLALAMLPTLFAVREEFVRIGEALSDYMGNGIGDATEKMRGFAPAVSAVGTVLETLVVLGANVSFVFQGIGRDLGAMAAQAVSLVSGDFKGFASIHEAALADAAKARAELDRFTDSVLKNSSAMSGAGKQTSIWSGLTAEQTRNLTGIAGAGAKATKAHLEFTDAASKANDATDKLVDAGAKLAVALNAQKAQLSPDFYAKWDSLSAAYRAGKLSVQQLEQAQKLLLEQQPFMVEAAKAEAEAEKTRSKATLEAAQAREKGYESLVKDVAKVREQVEAQNAANLSLATGRDVTDELAVAKLRQAANTAELNAIAYEEKNLYDATSQAMRDQAATMRELADAKEKGIGLKAAKEANDAWLKTIDSISNGLTDSLYRAFESGKSFFKTFWDGLVNTFKTTVLKLAVQAVMNPVNQFIGGALGIPSLANAAGGAGGASTLLGGASLLGSIGTFGSWAGAGLDALMGGYGLTALGSAGSLIGGGSLAAGLGVAAGVLGPLVLGGLALNALFADHSASLGYGSTTGGRLFSFGEGGDRGAQSDLTKLANTVFGTTSDLAALLGGSAKGLSLQAATDVDRRNLGEGVFGWRNASGAISTVATNTTGNAGQDSSKLGAWFEAYSSNAILQGLQQSNLPQRFRDYFGQVSAASIKPEDAAAMLQTAQSVKMLTDQLAPLGGVFSMLGRVSIETVTGLAQLTGGMDALLGKVQGYVKNYYTADEQLGIAAVQINTTLKAAGIDTSLLTDRASFRAAVEATGAGLGQTSASQAQLAALLNAADAFSAIADQLGGRSLADVAGAAGGGVADLLVQGAEQADIGQQQVNGLATVNDSIVAGNTTIATKLDEVVAALASVASNTAATAQQLWTWDDGGALATVGAGS